ncbi:SRPBCC family protein [Novosphingobium huizhouense]|uniref:SRPBCC domain-containing protein n=1 Tax=Novosphingobium huizhouense TaxID=2866625 RepID=UPI001CD87E69|nr:SRPBCC domain-containing protein [Novosphingobium huizhouense]
MFQRPALALLLAAATIGPARAEVVAKGDSGFVVRVAARVTSDPAATWKALSAPAQWWQGQHTFSGDAANLTLDPVPGGCFCERLPLPKTAAKGERPGGVQHMRVLYAEPGKALRLSGALGPLQSEAVQGTLTITIKPIDGGSRIVFDYVVGGYMRYPVAEIAPAVDAVIAAQLASLAMKLGPMGGAPASTPAPASASAPTPGPAADSVAAADPAAPSPSGDASAAALAPQGWSLPPGPGSKPARRAAPLAPPPAAAAAPAAAKPAAPKPPARPAVAPAAKPAARPPAKPAAKPVAKPVDQEHEDANAAFDALLGPAPTPQ